MLVRPESNSRPPAWQLIAQPTEPQITLEANFPTTSRRAAFFPAKSTGFWRPKSLFSTPEPSPSWLVLRARTVGTKIPPVSARGPLFRRAGTTSWGGLGPPKFFGSRAEKFAFTRQKSSRLAPYYWPACQNLGVPCRKWMSCKCALSCPFCKGYRRPKMEDFQNALISRLFGVFACGLLHRTTVWLP